MKINSINRAYLFTLCACMFNLYLTFDRLQTFKRKTNNAGIRLRVFNKLVLSGIKLNYFVVLKVAFSLGDRRGWR
jgi:hypothetical protein